MARGRRSIQGHSSEKHQAELVKQARTAGVRPPPKPESAQQRNRPSTGPQDTLIGEQLTALGFKSLSSEPPLTKPVPSAVELRSSDKIEGRMVRVSPPHESQPSAAASEVAHARAHVRDTEIRVREAKRALEDANRALASAQSNLHKVLVQHGLVATKRSSASKETLKTGPKPMRETPKVPSHQETGTMTGMTKPVPPVDKAIRNAQEAFDQGYVHVGKAPKPPKQKSPPHDTKPVSQTLPPQPAPTNSAISKTFELAVDDRTMERQQDATRDYWGFRDNGRFGSHASHDNYDN